MKTVLWIFSCLLLSMPIWVKASTPFKLFEEKIYTVTTEQDHNQEGSLRNTINRANRYRASHPFQRVRIRFDSMVKRIQLNGGPLPDLSGGMTTLDCRHPEGRVVIEGVSKKITSAPQMGLRIASQGNRLLACHWTGFQEAVVELSAPRNEVIHNVFGYHPQYSESKPLGSIRYGKAKSNQGPGILLSPEAWSNVIKHNHFVAGGLGGILLAKEAGGNNYFFKNYFFKNRGKPIQALSQNSLSSTPRIKKISNFGEIFQLQGSASPHAQVEAYLWDPINKKVSYPLGKPIQANDEGVFQLEFKNPGFLKKKNHVVALAQCQGKNTSLFSRDLSFSFYPKSDNRPTQAAYDSHNSTKTPSVPEEKYESLFEKAIEAERKRISKNQEASSEMEELELEEEFSEEDPLQAKGDNQIEGFKEEDWQAPNEEPARGHLSEEQEKLTKNNL